ncbi:MAG TPA: type II toxin-antitoxin system PemK/MazF family toxin [Cellulomonas sp.]
MVDDASRLLPDRPWLLLVGLAALAVLVALGRRRARGRRAGRTRSRGRRPAPRPGEVWFALVPFEDGTGAKDRPVLVLAIDTRTCTIARLTSQDQDARRDYARVPPGVPGLRRSSWVSLRPQALDRSAFRRRIGDPGAALVAWYRGQPAHR